MTGASPSVTDSLDSNKLRFIDVGGVRTRIYETGTGDPLVLVHGGQFGGPYSLDSWSLNLPALSKKFHVYAMDKLGQGHTDNPQRPEEYTFETLYDHTITLLDALGIKQAHFVGHSRGALLVTRLALECPALVKRLVIVDSNSASPSHEGSGDFYANIKRRLPPGPPTRETVRIEPDAQSYSRDHITNDFLDRRLEIARLPKTREAQQRMREIGSSVWMPSLERVREQTFHTIGERGLPVPALLVWGYNDRAAPLHQGLELFDLICLRTPAAELHVLNGASHYCFRERADTFNRLIQGFCLGGFTDDR